MTPEEMIPEAVLAFWFGDDPNSFRDEWFQASAAFDAECTSRFSDVLEAGAEGRLDRWAGTPNGTLALVIVLDQFARNIRRGTPGSFEQDARARHVAREALARRFDHALSPIQRVFLYLPFQHSEHIADQNESVRLFETLRGTFPQAEEAIGYALLHREVVRRFGRFPHRNVILGRNSSEAERDWLARHQNGF